MSTPPLRDGHYTISTVTIIPPVLVGSDLGDNSDSLSSPVVIGGSENAWFLRFAGAQAGPQGTTVFTYSLSLETKSGQLRFCTYQGSSVIASATESGTVWIVNGIMGSQTNFTITAYGHSSGGLSWKVDTNGAAQSPVSLEFLSGPGWMTPREFNFTIAPARD